MRRLMAAPLLLLIALYQRAISPWLPTACRFHPTCSEYMKLAILAHGPARGVWLGLQRLGRCHPWNAGGLDPVPTRK
jgi:putative membrane protein insertion efficiency factor